MFPDLFSGYSEARSPPAWDCVEHGHKKEVPALEDKWISSHEVMRNKDQSFTAFPWNHSAVLGMAQYTEWKQQLLFNIERQGRRKLILSATETKRNWKLSCLKGIFLEILFYLKWMQSSVSFFKGLFSINLYYFPQSIQEHACVYNFNAYT